MPSIFLGNDRAGLRPLHIPVSFVRRNDDAFAVPVDQVFRSREAKLRIFLVVSRVGQVIGIAELNEPGIFDAAIFLVDSAGTENRLIPAREMNSVGALGISQARSALFVLRAVEHHDLAAAHDRPPD